MAHGWLYAGLLLLVWSCAVHTAVSGHQMQLQQGTLSANDTIVNSTAGPEQTDATRVVDTGREIPYGTVRREIQGCQGKLM